MSSLCADFPTLGGVEAHSLLDAPKSYAPFVSYVLAFYGRHGRSFPWRESDDPYRIFLSEVMLQQTQTGRVLAKYQEFLTLWPALSDLAKAPFDLLLDRFRGLGYNRRARNLKLAAMACEAWGYTLPCDEKRLLSLPGVGVATAAAILAFAYHVPSLYLETNIRRALIHSFHHGEDQVDDKSLREDLASMLSYVDDVKKWYYALMDYGALLKHLVPNPNLHSRGYRKQSPFHGSLRQVRGMLVHALSESGPLGGEAIYRMLPFEKERIDAALDGLVHDGILARFGGQYRIPSLLEER